MVVEAEVVAISAAFAVTAARVLDLEVFQKVDETAYLDAKRTERLGQVVDGMVLIRNAEIHMPVVLEPDADRVLSLQQRGRPTVYRVMPFWRPYSELPAAVRIVTKERVGTAERCHDAYKAAVAGASIMETLLDALAWFLECDPSLARRDAKGELEGFPLTELWQHEYERRHPEWPRVHEVAARIRADAESALPGGKLRAVRHRLVTDDGTVLAYFGYTRTLTGGDPWAETPAQVGRDVVCGYPYLVEGTSNSYVTAETDDPSRLTLDGETLCSGGQPLSDLSLLPFVDPDEKWWRWFLDFTAEDAFKYVEHRRGL